MKLTTRQEPLAAVTAWATATARIGTTRLPSPVLAGLLLTAAADGTLTVAAYDYETSALARVTGAETGEPGRALIPARMLTQAAASLPAGTDVTITTDGTRATIIAGQVTYTLLMLPDDEFPALPEPGEPAATFGADFLAAAVAQVLTAASHDDTLPALCCVHLTLDGNGTATLAATDRYRLAAVTCPYTPAGDGAPPGPVLIPARELAAAVKQPEAATVSLALPGGTLAAFTTAGRHVTVRTIAAEFPAYATLIPEGDAIEATVTAGLADLAAAVKRAAVVAERDTPVRLGFPGPGVMHIEAGTGDEAAYTEDIPAETGGDPSGIAFKPAFLLDALAAVAATGAERVRFALTGPARPALITLAEPGGPVTARHVLMPIRGTG